MIPIIKSCCSRSPLRRLGTLLLAGLLLLPAAGCGGKESTQGDTLRVGVALYTQDDTFISTIVHSLSQLIYFRFASLFLGL